MTSVVFQGNSKAFEWHPHIPESFKKAQAEDKLVLVDLDAEWCFWCRKMEQETYYSPKVKSFILRHFIPIRVDIEKQPGFKKRYMKWGLPNYTVLTSKGEVVFSSSGFLNATDFLDILKQVKTREPTPVFELDEEMELRRELELENNFPPKHVLEIPTLFTEDLKHRFDKENGGFSVKGLIMESEPKYPLAMCLIFLLTFQNRLPDKFKKKMIQSSITAIENNLWDKEAGGLYRYCEEPDWSIPHTEKVLYVQVRFFLALALASKILSNDHYIRSSRQIKHYIINRLLARDTARFFGFEKAKNGGVAHVTFTSYSAEAIFSFFEAGGILNDSDLKEVGQKALAFLKSHLYLTDIGLRHYFEKNQAIGSATLEDYGWSILAFLKGHEITKSTEYLFFAEELVQQAQKLFDKELSEPQEMAYSWLFVSAYIMFYKVANEGNYLVRAQELAEKLSPFFFASAQNPYEDATNLEQKAGYALAIMQLQSL